MKNFTKLLLGSLVLFSLSGCTAGDMITSYTSISDQSETTLQNTSETPKQRVYMDEIKGTLKDFTGATLTMESQEQNERFYLYFQRQCIFQERNFMLRGAIWDLDGTILDSMSAWDHVGENYLRSQGIEPEPDLDEAIATMSLHQAADYFIEHYGVKQTRDELIKSAVAIVDDFYRYEAQLKPHLKEFLAQLHETGVKMCIATATERSLVEAALARCGVLDYFSEIFTCSSVGAGKDEPAIYREALKFLGTDRTNTMVFEDSLHALTTAKKDGFYTTAVYDSHEENQEEIQRLANCRIRDYSELEEFINFVKNL